MLKGVQLRPREGSFYMSHMRVGIGDVNPSGGLAGNDRDSFVFAPSGSSRKTALTLDHCDVVFGVDDCLDINSLCSDVSLYGCFLGWALRNSIHPSGEHDKALLTAAERLSIARCFIYAVNRLPVC